MSESKHSTRASFLATDPNRTIGLGLRQDSFVRLAQGQTQYHRDDQINGANQISDRLIDNDRSINRKWYQRLLALPAYYWVLITQPVVILPHAAHLPFWLMGFAVVTVIAQLPAVKGRVSSKHRLKRWYQSMQMLGFLLGLVGLWLTYRTAFGLDMGVAFLLLCLVSKLWELYRRRDAYVVLNLSLFVLASLFLMDQGLMTTLLVVIGTLLTLLAFIALNDDGNQDGAGRLRVLLVLGVSALPLLAVLFVFFPRLPPLWSVQLSGQSATTGVSDSMSPGDFANLGQSTELAFRAEFQGQMPPQSELYWRGLVFSDFDGVTWRPDDSARREWQWQSGKSTPDWINNALATANDADKLEPTRYQIILEPTQQRWIFGLDYPLSQRQDLSITSDFTLVKDQPVTQQLRYQALRYAPMQIDPVLSDAARQTNLELPATGNPKARALAKKMFIEAGSDPKRYIQAIRRWISQGDFRYTLSPPQLQDDRVDEFLFGTQAGFCEHYSSSFTFMMRAAGIPARVVAGYQGGELGRDGAVWEVRQMDAHAWSEVWLEGQGWVRVDPTAFVAPDRVEEGMDALTNSRGASMFGDGAGAQISYQQYELLQSLRRLSDQAGYYWQRDIVGFDQDKQAGALFKWFNIRTIGQQIAWLAAATVIIAALLVTLLWQRRRKRWHRADYPLIKLSKRLGKKDSVLARQTNEGLIAWLSRLSQLGQTNPELTEDNQQRLISIITDIKHSYRQLRYGRISQDSSQQEYQQQLKQLKRQVKQLQKIARLM